MRVGGVGLGGLAEVNARGQSEFSCSKLQTTVCGAGREGLGDTELFKLTPDDRKHQTTELDRVQEWNA